MKQTVRTPLFMILIIVIVAMLSFPCCTTPAVETPQTQEPEQPSTSSPSQPESQPPAQQPAPEPKEAVLKYHDSYAEAFLAAENYGYIVSFVPPKTPFTITEIGIVGRIYGVGWEGKEYTVSLWDKDYQVLYSADYPFTQFDRESANLAIAEVPDIIVNGDFYVHVFTGTGRNEGIHVGADDSRPNEHSGVTEKSGDTFKISNKWPYPTSQWFGDKSKVNWLITAVGTYTE